MKLDSLKLAGAVAAAFGLAWAFCSLLVVVLPDPLMMITGHMVHADLSGLDWKIGAPGFVAGLLAWMISSGAIAGITAVLYNKGITRPRE